MKTQKLISDKRIKRIKSQGYSDLNSYEISCIAFGNRFAYILCTIILTYGIVTMNLPVLIGMLIVAVSSILLPYHPFDYIYNYGLRIILNKPKLPKRSIQLKFACTVATVFITGIIFLFYTGSIVSGYVVGALLLTSAFLVSILDICLPSIIFNECSGSNK